MNSTQLKALMTERLLRTPKMKQPQMIYHHMKQEQKIKMVIALIVKIIQKQLQTKLLIKDKLQIINLDKMKLH